MRFGCKFWIETELGERRLKSKIMFCVCLIGLESQIELGHDLLDDNDENMFDVGNVTY